MDETRVEQLLKEHATPFYLFDQARLEQRVQTLQETLPGDFSLCYAIKANPFLVKVLSPLVDRLEICSAGEYAICRDLGLPPRQFVLSGVYKEPRWVAEVVRQPGGEESIYTVESMQQYQVLQEAARAAGKRLTVLLRLTSGNQFGLEKEEIQGIFADPAPELDLLGIQYFSGTQKTSLKRLRRELETVDTFLETLEQTCGKPVRELEFGPGFPVSYFDEEEGEEEAFLAEAAALLGQLRFQGKRTLELGRSIAAHCGDYFTRVVDAKTNGGQRYAIVDGGIHQLVYYGQSLAMRQPPVAVHPPRTVEDPQPWNLCGSLCTINDILVKQLPLSDLKIGDVLQFKKTGAYCMTEGIALFLSHALPKVLLLGSDGKVTTLREEQETYGFNRPND